jgi:glycine cleavage system H protein
MKFPEQLLYTSHDEWIEVKDGVATVGITAFAQDALGDLVHVELPEVGDDVSAGDAICEVESVKAVAEIFTPVAGTVVEVNEDLDGEEEKINEDPYGEGWLFKLEVTDASGLDGLMDAATYAAKVG